MRVVPDEISSSVQTEDRKGFLGGIVVKNPPANAGDVRVGAWCWEDPLGVGTAPNSKILAWRTPWTEEPGGLQSMGWQKVRHD